MRSSRSAPDPLEPGALGFAHRGLHGPAVPENSLAAFRAAAAFNCGIECDVRLARDGVPVVFHDADLRRLCGMEERIDARDGHWLGEQVLLDTQETIPTLVDALGQWPDHLPLLIECKTFGNNGSELTAAVARALDQQPRQAGVMSFDPSVGQWLSAHRSDLLGGLVVDADWPADFRSHAVDYAQPQFLAVDIRVLDDPWTASMRASMPVYCWTVRTSDQRRTASVHADALIWEGDGRP